MNELGIETIELANDFSIWSLFWNASFVVQMVIVILIIASFWTWSIIFSKTSKIKQLQKLANKFEKSFWSTGALDKLQNRLQGKAKDPLSAVFVVGMTEWQRSNQNNSKTKISLQQRIEKVMTIVADKEIEKIEKHMDFLASVGSTAPFIGLFGTVWGIMNSFSNIASSQSTNLSVVAPGIAEALFATALGLIAAIPAVLAYNILNNKISEYTSRLENFISEFTTITSRKLDED